MANGQISNLSHSGSGLLTISYGISLYASLADRLDSFITLDIFEAAAHVSAVASFLKLIADILLIVTLAELCTGFLLCITGTPARSSKIIRWSTLAIATILAILAIAVFGLAISYNRAIHSPSTTSSSRAAMRRDGLALNQLSGTIEILLWLCSMPLLGYASYVMHKGRTLPHLQNVGPVLSLLAFPPANISTSPLPSS